MLEFLKSNGRPQDRAANADNDAPAKGRPTIGLALGGGAARGFAHIGVIRTLTAKGLKPDVICGTSIGAVVGGALATDRLDVLEAWARSLSRRRVLGYLDVSLGGSGLIAGARLAARLDDALGNMAIEDLPVRFAAIATEIGTGHEIWLTRGRLADALRASYTLPGIFAPARVGGRWLVDGALVNPVPVAAARALGARLVVAVNLNAELFGRGTTIPSHGSDESDTLRQALGQRRGLRRMLGSEREMKRQVLGTPGSPGLMTVMSEAFNIMQDRITRARLAGDPPDVLIQPRLGSVGLFDFHRADETIALGAEAAERAIGPLVEAVAALTG
ncbi:MAG TPA: patatin-like phospholipase family protein [Xanthobacteraceae bacterium]|nr:patatin-like phospholipase family protein [Xanthobacteraceae bacterium]